MDLKPQQKLGQYTVLRKLAEGGMAEIYLASRGGASGFSKNCVIKRVKAQHRADEKFREMFELEAKLAANLEHSNIVQIFDFQSADDGELYLAMQYVDGCSLEQLRRLLPEGVMPPFLAARIARDVASALAYAYACPGPDGQPLRLVHRDISPHNVLVSRQGEVKLTDFGIAKPVSKETSGGFKGKIAYMAPEQARGSPVDARTDVFALGVVLFELVTGSRPFDAPTDIALIHELATGSAPAPDAASLGVPVPDELAEILARSVQRQPEHRYHGAEEMVRALEAFMRHAPSEVDTDLARFVVERLGAVAVEPSQQVPRLDTHAFDDTLASGRHPMGATALGVTPGKASDATMIPGRAAASATGSAGRPQTAALAVEEPEKAPARRRLNTLAPESLPAQRPTTGPMAAPPRPGDPTLQAIPAIPKRSEPELVPTMPARRSPAPSRAGPAKGAPVPVAEADEPTPQPLLSPKMWAVAGVLGLVALSGAAWVGYQGSKSHEPAQVIDVKTEPVAKEEPKAVPVAAPPKETKTETTPTSPSTETPPKKVDAPPQQPTGPTSTASSTSTPASTGTAPTPPPTNEPTPPKSDPQVAPDEGSEHGPKTRNKPGHQGGKHTVPVADPAPPPTNAPMGTVHVKVEPYAVVYSDARARPECTETPCDIHLTAGKHRLRFRYNTREEGREVMIEAGRTVQISITFGQ